MELKEEKDNLFKTNLHDEYKTFLDNNETRLQKQFDIENDFQTNTRGVKIRGVFPTQEEAEMRCNLLREPGGPDPAHDVYCGPVGVWMPWEPEAYKTGRVEYLEDELNQLMHNKQVSEEGAKEMFDKRVRESKEKAIADNIEKAKASGNRLTQTINKNGDLINIANTNENVSVADLRKELFESDNVVMDKNTDHGLSRLTNPVVFDLSGN